MLVFFGYTFCPDVCPTTLATVSAVLDELGAAAEQVQPLFVTVDPERDSPQVLADYVQAFHPRVVEQMIRDVFDRHVFGTNPFRIEQLWRRVDLPLQSAIEKKKGMPQNGLVLTNPYTGGHSHEEGYLSVCGCQAYQC